MVLKKNTLLDTLTHITVFFFFFIRAHCASMWHFIAAAVAALCVCVYAFCVPVYDIPIPICCVYEISACVYLLFFLFIIMTEINLFSILYFYTHFFFSFLSPCSPSLKKTAEEAIIRVNTKEVVIVVRSRTYNMLLHMRKHQSNAISSVNAVANRYTLHTTKIAFVLQMLLCRICV